MKTNYAPFNRLPNARLLSYLFFLLILQILVNARLDFHQLHNDFWDCYFIARHLSFGDVQTWFNPQFPIGYCLFLRFIVHGGFPVTPAIIANLLFGIIILLSATFLYRRVLNAWAAFFSVLGLSLYPRLFNYVNVGGADPGSIAFFSIGAGLIVVQVLRETQKRSCACFLAGGIFLGLGGLFRYHVFIGGVLFLLSLIVIYRRKWRSITVAGIGLLLAYSPQWMINIITGHHLFETILGWANIYNLMYKLDWYHTITLSISSSPIAIILHDPWLFARRFAVVFFSCAPAYLLPVAATFSAQDPKLRKLCGAISLWTFAYFFLLTAVYSSRLILLPIPLVFLAGGLIIQEAWPSTLRIARPALQKSAAIVLCCALAVLFIVKDYQKIILRARERNSCVAVESCLRSLGCVSVRQIFSTDFDIYFRTLPPYIPFFNGGVPRWGTYLFNEEYPEFPVDSQEIFARACRERGVRFVLLTPRAKLLSPELGALYDKGTSQIFTLRKEIDRFRIFEVTTDDARL